MTSRAAGAPLLTVVITVYDIRQDWTAAAIDSILTWHDDLEVMIVDDGSTDASLVLFLNELSANEPRVRYFRQENAGTGAARRTGLDLAQGRWVTLMDPDDYMIPAPGVVSALSTAEREDLVISAAIGVGEDGTQVREQYSIAGLGANPSATNLATELMSIYLHGRESAAFLLGVPWAKFFRTTWLREQDLNFDHRVVKRSDAEWLLRAFAREPRVLGVDEPTVAYRLGVGYSGAFRYREGTLFGYEVLRTTAEGIPGVPDRVRQLYRLELLKDGINSIFSNPKAPKSARSRAEYRQFRNEFRLEMPLLQSGTLNPASFSRKALYVAIRYGSFLPVMMILSWKRLRLALGR